MRASALALLLLPVLSSVSPPARSAGASSSVRPARRVVALAPNLTEIVFAIGAEKSLVAVSDFSDYPPAALSLPRIGGLDPSAERIASLSPDLVLVSAEGGN